MAEKTKAPPEPAPSIYTKNLVRAPGPGKYDMDKYSTFASGNKGAHRYSFGSRPRPLREAPTPGPQYNVAPPAVTGPRWSMGAKFIRREKEDSVPPPADGKAVVPPTVPTSFGRGPKISMSGRTRSIRTDVTPAPGKYDALSAFAKTAQRVPAYSMSARFHRIEKDPYFVESEVKDGKAVAPLVVKSLIGQGPKYSMSGRTRQPRDHVTPGPGNYGGPTETFGKSAPRFTMSARVNKGIAFGFFGGEPRLREPVALPQLQVVESR